MMDLIQGSGIFVYPLGLCSFLAVFIIIERLIALRAARTLPEYLATQLIEGKIPEHSDPVSVAGRIIWFFQHKDCDADQLKAFARLQITGMERGLFILEIVISAAPLLGLLGTVTGLVHVFAQISPDSGLPDTKGFVEGVALALTTTILGLGIAIPSLIFNSFLNRRIDTLAARIHVGVERLISLKKKSEQSER
jgi:biopolymer transport protein ExbB